MKTLPTFFILFFLFAQVIQVDASVPDEAKQTATKVFNQLKRSIGLTPNDPPFFELTESLPGDQFVMAMINHDDQKIFLEMTAYDLCKNVDAENALAFFLGHELAHFMQNHKMKNHYVRGFHGDMASVVFEEMNVAPSKSVQEQVTATLFSSMTQEAEKEADLEGGFLAYISGYKTANIGERLLKAAYAIYQLDTAATNYPSLSERIRIVNKTENELEGLIDYFETGNLLVAVGEYEDALLYYKKVLSHFQSREIYNNIGVLYTLTFLDKVRQDKFKYAFPLELDMNSRAKSREVVEEELNKYLHHAIEHFDLAIAKDKQYPIAQLNRGCAHLLMGMNTKAGLVRDEQFAISRAAALSSLVLSSNDPMRWRKTEADAHVLFGIIEAESGDSEKANAAFDKALTLMPNNTLAKRNKQVVATGKAAAASNRRSASFGNSRRERIDNQANFVMNVDKSVTMQKDKEKEVVFSIKALNQSGFSSRVLFNEVTQLRADMTKPQESFTIFQITNPDYPKDKTTELGLKIGDSRDQIIAAYGGEPDTEIGLNHGSWLVYKSKAIIFQLDTDGKLARWCVYERG